VARGSRNLRSSPPVSHRESGEVRMPKKLNVDAIRPVIGTRYPAPYDAPCKLRERKRLGDAAGLTQFGVNLQRLPPGAWSSQRHWHTAEDEFIVVMEGEVVLVTEGSEEVLRAGDCAGFPANDPNGHHLQNRSSRDALILEVGSRDPADGTTYPDIDMEIAPGSDVYTHRDGSAF
jgi:uncharacterized cupin superfamily protein